REPAGLPRQLPLLRHRHSRRAGRGAHENRQADFLHLGGLGVPDCLPRRDLRPR
ncbi:phosphopentomutase, partial [Pluralibacter gergoviae]